MSEGEDGGSVGENLKSGHWSFVIGHWESVKERVASCEVMSKPGESTVIQLVSKAVAQKTEDSEGEM